MIPEDLGILLFEDLSGERVLQKLDEYEERVEKCYIGLRDSNIDLFNKLMDLHSQLLTSMYGDTPGFRMKYNKKDLITKVIIVSGCGSFRNLRVAYKLLLKGFFPEMHCILRMVEQWLEVAVCIQGDPQCASLIWERGFEKKERYLKAVKKKINRTNNQLACTLNEMEKEFHLLSQRCHSTKTAFNLMTVGENSEDVLPGFLFDEEFFANSAFNLARLTVNALTILLEFFLSVSPEWKRDFDGIRQVICTAAETERVIKNSGG